MNLDPAHFTITFVTTPDLDVARKIARALLEAKLVACVSLAPKIESFYWWENKIEQADEVLLIMKSTAVLSDTLKKAILAIHPYTTPEIVTIALDGGSENYLRWISESVAAGPGRPLT